MHPRGISGGRGVDDGELERKRGVQNEKKGIIQVKMGGGGGGHTEREETTG